MITEVFWVASCKQHGTITEAPNGADEVCNKVKTHLNIWHANDLRGEVHISPYMEARPVGTLPALGRTSNVPSGVSVTAPATTFDAAAIDESREPSLVAEAESEPHSKS
jgi:hypothetical protein